MIIGYPELVLLGGLFVGVFALGAFISSRLNHAVIKAMRRDLEHMRNNQKAIRQALEAREAKEDARHEAIAANLLATSHAIPLEVHVTNNASEPVPTQDVAK